MQIPIDNLYWCEFHRRTPGGLQSAFWHVLESSLDREQAKRAIGSRTYATERFDDFRFTRPIIINETNGQALLPAVKIHGQTAAGNKTDSAIRYALTFSIRVKSGWQRDVILGVLREFAGKYFRFDMGGNGAHKRRLPETGGSIVSKVPTLDMRIK